eukprot:TRINITY_DN2500_c0_g1_i2.p1 TRINITY_DN2500_c0_g1~~TRINITY_DN2500_c0_g1_i2.p1  ORF type:complete len:963 (+),score=192.46 TRINITY_DN2500_c0_g1_i2:52-2940(+)
MQPQIVRPVQLTPRWVFFLDFCFVWILYLVCVENDMDGANWADETKHFDSTESLFDVALLSTIRTMLLIYTLTCVKQGRSNIIAIVCVLLQLLMIAKCIIYDYDDLKLANVFLLVYVQLIGMLEFFSVVLPPGSTRQMTVNSQDRGDESQPLLLDLESGARSTNYRSTDKNIASRAQKTARNEYSDIIEKTTKRLKDSAKNDGTWEQSDTTDNIQIYKRQDGPLTSSKGVGVIPVSPRTASFLVRNLDARKKWDEMFQEGDLVEVIDKSTRVLHLRFKSVWPTAPRDMCLIEHAKEEEDGTFIVVSTSIRHAQVPANPNFVRGDLQCGGWILAPIAGKPNATKATYVVQVDPCGSIPLFVINMMATKQPLCIAAVRKCVEKEPHLITQVEEEENDVESGTLPNAQPSATRKSHKEFTPLPDEFANARSRPRFAENSRTAFTRLYDAAMGAEAEGWQSVGDIDGVKVSKQYSSTTGVASFKGVGVIQAHPKDVFEMVTNLGRRRDWDHMYKEGAVVETMNSNNRIVYLSFHPQVMTWPRDFCLLESRRVNPETNSYHIAVISTLHPSVPEFSGFVRGETMFGGYIIEPFGSMNYTKLIYCASIHPKGWIPLSVVNSVSTKQPLIIAALRDLLATIHPSPMRHSPMNVAIMQDQQRLDAGASGPSYSSGAAASFSSTPGGARPPVVEMVSGVDHHSSPLQPGNQSNIFMYIEKMQGVIDRLKVESVGGEDEGWVFHSRQQEVDISMKKIGDQQATRGVTILDYPINVVHWYISQTDRKTEWDSMFLSATTVELIIPTASVSHYKFKAIFPTSPRDFCSIACRLIEPDGTHILASTAVEHPAVPPDPGFIRGELVTSGFLLRAISSSQTQVTYIVHVDPKGSIPPFVSNTVAVKQPLCLAAIRSAMNKYRNQLQSDFVPPPEAYRPLSSFLPDSGRQVKAEEGPVTVAGETHSDGYVSFDDEAAP